MGLVEDLESGPSDSHATYAFAPFIEQVRQAAEVLGHAEVGPTLYDMVTSTITSVTYVELPADGQPGAAAIDSQTRAMTVYDEQLGAERMMALYAHEAAHPWLQTHHVECAEEFTPAFMSQAVPAGAVVCDDDWTGAHGFHAAEATLGHEYFQPDI